MKKYLFKKKYIISILTILIIIFCIIYYNNTIIEIPDEEIALAGGVTPQMFGAKGDGIKNDTKAVQAAIDYVAKNNLLLPVYIPEGIYSVRNLKLKQGVSLVGEGEKSILLADPSCKTWDGILYCYNLKSATIRNITFDGNKPIVSGDHQKGTANMWIRSSSNIEIRDCSFQNNWYLGICLKNSDNIVIESNDFVNLDCGVITTEKPSNNITINDNYFDGAEYSEPISIFALEEGYHNNITITNNIMKNHIKGSGILLRAVKNVTVQNNLIDNCGTGIYCTASKYNNEEYGVYNAVIENNTIVNTVYEGILLTYISDSKVQNNIIENPGSYGLLTKYVNNSTIDNNIFVETDTVDRPYHGFVMTITGMLNSTVSNNQINIFDLSTKKDRYPISISSINGSTNISSDNIFIGNQVSPIVDNLYRVDSQYSINNVYAAD